MKPLPPDPPVYELPAARWFERHEHEGSGIVSAVRTLTAMLLTLHDRMRLPAPAAERKFPLTEQEQLARLVDKFGRESVMTVWRDACGNIEKGETPEAAFKGLLAGKGLKDE